MRKGWEKCNLEDYIKLIDYRGRTPVKTSSGVRLITAKNVKLGYLQLEPQEFINPKNYASWMTRGIPNLGDVIFTTEAPLANVAQVDTTEKIAFAQRIIVMQPRTDKINQTFLKYLLLSEPTRSMILEKGTGATVTGIKSSLLKKIPISFPPLPEQKRIVAILDKAFAAIDRAKANTQRNLQNAKDLFESYLQNVFANPREDWEEKRLGDVCEIGDGNYSSKYPKASEFVSSGVPFLTATNLKNGTITPDGIRFISHKHHLKLTKGHIKENDLVIVVRGSSTGNNSIVPKQYENSNLNSQLAFLRVKDKKVYSEYLFSVFNSPQVQEVLRSAISGAAQPQLPNNRLLDIKILYPDKFEQEKIVRKIKLISAETKNLEENYKQKLIDLEELKKSILQKAFAGELR